MSILKSGASSTLARTGVTLALAAATVGALATSSQAATTQQALVLSSLTGSSAGGSTITLSLATTASPKFSTGAVGVQFQATAAPATATCATNPATNAAATAITVPNTSLRFLSTTKVSVVTPDFTNSGAIASPTANWLVCAYNIKESTGTIASTATVIGKGNFIVAAPPTIALNSASPAGVVPASGPAVGGQTITVNGTNFPTTITASTPLTATLGGLPLTSITPVNATSFTGVTPVHLTGAAALSVTTAGGTVTSSTNEYSYVNGITVSPATVASGVSVDVDVQGTGFSLLTFVPGDTSGVDSGNGTAVGTNADTPHVYLVQGTYSRTGYGAGADKAKGQSSECINPAVISDTELICTVDAASSIDSTTSAGTYDYTATALPNGAYTITVVDKGAAAPVYSTVLSSGATFTVANF